MSQIPLVVDVVEERFEEEVLERSAQLPVLVDFWAPWCGPCKVLLPMLEALAAEYGGKFVLAKVNIDEEQGLAARFGVRSVPTVKLFRGGRVVDEFLGAQPESEVRRLLDRYVERESDKLRAEANAAVESGDLDGAVAILRRAMESDPESARVRLDLAGAVALKGESDEASALLDGIRGEAADSLEVRSLRAKIGFSAALRGAPDEAALRAALEADANDHRARYRLASLQALRGEYEAALELLLTLLGKDRTWGEEAARKGILGVFDILGDGDPLVKRYRSRLFALMH